MAQTKEQAHAWYLKNKERRKLMAQKNKAHIAAVKHAYYLKQKAERKLADRARYLELREHNGWMNGRLVDIECSCGKVFFSTGRPRPWR